MDKATSHLASEASDQSKRAELESRAWEAIKKARDVLRLPVPDTFLGRQHYDFISPPDDNKE